jgi:hypothetical protein
MSLRPICASCRKFFRPKKTGYNFMEGMPFGERGDGRWKPYKLWSGDLWECKACGTEIIVGTGKNPISEHFYPDFAQACERAKAHMLIEDC